MKALLAPLSPAGTGPTPVLLLSVLPPSRSHQDTPIPSDRAPLPSSPHCSLWPHNHLSKLYVIMSPLRETALLPSPSRAGVLWGSAEIGLMLPQARCLCRCFEHQSPLPTPGTLWGREEGSLSTWLHTPDVEHPGFAPALPPYGSQGGRALGEGQETGLSHPVPYSARC